MQLPSIPPPISALATDCDNILACESNNRTNQFLDNTTTHPDAVLTFRASDMHLWAHTDASYLSESKARSRCGGYYYLSSFPNLPLSPDDSAPPKNGPITTTSKIIDAVMSSAQEAEIGASFYNATQLLPLRLVLEEMVLPFYLLLHTIY